jgi:hypothetical protein
MRRCCGGGTSDQASDCSSTFLFDPSDLQPKKKRARANPYETATMYARHAILSYLIIEINVKLDLGRLLARRMENDTG